MHESNTIIKLGLFGDAKVGKTALSRCLLGEEKDIKIRCYSPTVTVASRQLACRSKLSPKQIGLLIYDTAGEEKYLPITNSYYRGCNIVAIVVDSSLSIEAQLKSIKKYYDDLKRNAHGLQQKILIIANQKYPGSFYELSEDDLSEFPGVHYFSLSVKAMLTDLSIKENLLEKIEKLMQPAIGEQLIVTGSRYQANSAHGWSSYDGRNSSRWWCCFIPCCKPEAYGNRENEPLLHGPRQT